MKAWCWSKPVPIADFGVYPNAARAANGVLAVVYGRPHHEVAFSADNGQTWQGYFKFSGGMGSFYDFIAAVEKDTFLLIYSREGRVVGTFITAKPKAKTNVPKNHRNSSNNRE